MNSFNKQLIKKGSDVWVINRQLVGKVLDIDIFSKSFTVQCNEKTINTEEKNLLPYIRYEVLYDEYNNLYYKYQHLKSK